MRRCTWYSHSEKSDERGVLGEPHWFAACVEFVHVQSLYMCVHVSSLYQSVLNNQDKLGSAIYVCMYVI